MRSINLILAVLILFSILGLTGCASLAPLVGIKETTFPPMPVEVTSSPSDAEVFVNDRFVGRTPCTTNVVLTFDTASWEPKEVPTIRVSKDGYRDEARVLELTRRTSIFGDPMSGPSKYEIRGKYDFELKKKE